MTRPDLPLAILLAIAVALLLTTAGPAMDSWLSQTQAADIAAAQQRQQQAQERAFARLRAHQVALCGNGVPTVRADVIDHVANAPITCTLRTPRGR